MPTNPLNYYRAFCLGFSMLFYFNSSDRYIFTSCMNATNWFFFHRKFISHLMIVIVFIFYFCLLLHRVNNFKIHFFFLLSLSLLASITFHFVTVFISRTNRKKTHVFFLRCFTGTQWRMICWACGCFSYKMMCICILVLFRFYKRLNNKKKPKIVDWIWSKIDPISICMGAKVNWLTVKQIDSLSKQSSLYAMKPINVCFRTTHYTNELNDKNKNRSI